MKNDLSQIIIDAAIEVHNQLGGPGLLEGIYETALCHELSLRGLQSQRQLPIPVVYKGVTVREPLYLDILVEKQLIIEVKAYEKDYPFYQAQLLTYLRMTGIKEGLLINFGKEALKEGIRRVFNQPTTRPLADSRK
jgi:GxxExxY protein